MKTLKRNNEYIRATEDIVSDCIKKGWEFTKKSEWKNNVRDNKQKKKEIAIKVADTMEEMEESVTVVVKTKKNKKPNKPNKTIKV